MRMPTTGTNSCRCRVTGWRASIRARTGISKCLEEREQVVVSSGIVLGLDSLYSRLALPTSTPAAQSTALNGSISNWNRSNLRILKRNGIHTSSLILISICILSIICLNSPPYIQALTLPLDLNQTTLQESTTTTQLQEILSTSSQLDPQTTTPAVDSSQDERSSTDNDDDDVESCPGLSEDATAKAKNLSDTQRLVNLQSCLQKKIRRKLRDSTRDSMELFDKLSLSGGCSASLMSLMSSLGQLKSYAFKFFDASAKIPSGMLYGLLSDFGDFDQCLSIRSDSQVTLDMEQEERAFSGKYCLLDFHMNYHIELAPNETVPAGIDSDGLLWDELVRNYWTSKSPKGFQIGMCFPSKCTDDDLDQIYKSFGESYNFKGKILLCQDSFDLRAQHTPDNVQRSILYVFYTFITMTLIGTSLHRSWTIFTSLSPMKHDNTFSTSGCSADKESSKNETNEAPFEKSCLSHLSGLRLFVILWITMGHSFLYPSASNYQHYRSIINMNLTRDSVWFATTNFTLGIDMLLYMAGMLLVFKFASSTALHTHTSKMRSSSSISLSECTGKIWCLLAEKIFRFWPTYFAVIALAIIVPLLGDGPMWPEMITKRIGESCRKNWWTNLLFINNFQKESEMCLPSSWFVSVLMQLFLIGSFILVIEKKYSSKTAMITLSTLLISSCAYSFVYAFHYKLNAPVIRMDESFVMEMDEDIWRLYTNVFNNLSPFLIGMLGGYQLLRFNKHSAPQVKSPISAWITELVYACAFGGLAALVLSSVFYQKYSPLGSSLYWSLHRLGWALFTGYVIHKCATGSWSLLKDLLSLSSFIPISRLIFVAYLVYPIFIHMHSGLVRDGLHVSIYNMFNVYITRLALTFSTSLFIHLLFEIPLNLLEELIYKHFWLSTGSHELKTSAGVGTSERALQEERRKSSTKLVLLETLPGRETLEVV